MWQAIGSETETSTTRSNRVRAGCVHAAELSFATWSTTWAVWAVWAQNWSGAKEYVTVGALFSLIFRIEIDEKLMRAVDRHSAEQGGPKEFSVDEFKDRPQRT